MTERIITHDGGICPVEDHIAIRPVYRGADDPARGVRIRVAPAVRLDWSHDGGPDDIVGYSIVQWSPREAKP